MVLYGSNHANSSLPLSPPAPSVAALLSCGVLPAHCSTPAKASPAPQLWPRGRHHPRLPSSLGLTISPAGGDAPAWGVGGRSYQMSGYHITENIFVLMAFYYQILKVQFFLWTHWAFRRSFSLFSSSALALFLSSSSMSSLASKAFLSSSILACISTILSGETFFLP